MYEEMWAYWSFFALMMVQDPSGQLALHQCGFATMFAMRVHTRGLPGYA